MEKQPKLKIKTWIIFENFKQLRFGVKEKPYILDATNLDVSEDELALCIQEQIYGSKIINEDKEEKDTRPVRCYICGKKMYYLGHSKSELEYGIYDYREQIGYVHASCIKFLKAQIKK